MLDELLKRYPCLKVCKNDIEKAKDEWAKCFKNGNKLLICGNGGSAADSEHIVGELMKGFLKERQLTGKQKSEMKHNCPQITDETLSKLQNALPAVALSSFTSLNTAFCNDVDPKLIYAQCLMGLGKKNDILFCISTSGNSKNVYTAAQVAKALGLIVIVLTGASGGELKDIANICICVPETETFKIQELHLPVYHYLCSETESQFFAD